MSAATAPHTPPADALKLLHQAAAQARDWHRRMAKVHGIILDGVQSPQESMYQVWGFHLLPSANMGEAKTHLQLMEGAMARLSSLAGDIERPGFLDGDKAKQERVAHGLQAALNQVRTEARAAAQAVQTANMKVANRDVGIAENLVAADKFVMDKAPEVMGDIVLAITKSEHAKNIVEGGAKVGLTSIAHASANLQGINIEGEIASIQDAAIEAAIDIVAGFVPDSKGAVKKVLFGMMKDIIAEAAKNGHGKSGDELHKVLVAAVNKGVMGTLEKLAKDHPILKNGKLRAALIKPVMKAVIGAEKAVVDGKDASEGFTDGLKSGAVGVVFDHGKDHGMKGAKDHPEHKAGGKAGAAHTAAAADHKPGAAAPVAASATTGPKASWMHKVLGMQVQTAGATH